MKLPLPSRIVETSLNKCNIFCVCLCLVCPCTLLVLTEGWLPRFEDMLMESQETHQLHQRSGAGPAHINWKLANGSHKWLGNDWNHLRSLSQPQELPSSSARREKTSKRA
eukprot:4807376-Amphidinium_carterae.1